MLHRDIPFLLCAFVLVLVLPERAAVSDRQLAVGEKVGYGGKLAVTEMQEDRQRRCRIAILKSATVLTDGSGNAFRKGDASAV